MKDVKGYKGIYKITKDGRIWSAYRNRFLNCYSIMGYRATDLKLNNKRKVAYIHRLVAKAFIPEISGKPTVNHKNGIKTDNRIENLEWCTQKENIRHSWAIGTSKPRYNLDHPCTKLSLKTIKTIIPQIDNNYGTLTRLAKKYKVSPSLIFLIKKGYRTTCNI